MMLPSIATPRPRRRALHGAVSALGALAVTAGLAACGSAPAAAPKPSAAAAGSTATAPASLTPVRFSEVIRSVFYAPQYVALAKGFFKKQGLAVSMVTAEGSNVGAAALLSGTADISLIGPETTLYVFNQHGTQTLVGFAQLTVRDGSFILSRKPIAHFRWHDLQGQSIVGWRPGSDPTMVLQHVLAEKGITANDLTNISPEAMVGAFESGKGQFIQEYEPVVSQLIANHTAYLDASVGQAAGPYPETTYVATAAFIKSHPQIVQKWTDAIYQAMRWVQGHTPKEVAKTIAPYFQGTSLTLLTDSVQRYEALHAWPKTPIMTRAEYATLENVLLGAHTIKQKVPYHDVMDMQFARQAVTAGA